MTEIVVGIFAFRSVKNISLLKKGNYVIVKDIVMDKECIYRNDDKNLYYIYFKDYFEMYDERELVSQDICDILSPPSLR